MHQSRETTAPTSTAAHSLHERGILSPPSQIDQQLASVQHKTSYRKAIIIQLSLVPAYIIQSPWLSQNLSNSPSTCAQAQDSIGGCQIIAMLQPALLQRPIHLHSFLAVNRHAAVTTTPIQQQNNAKMAMDPDLANSFKNDTMHGPSRSLRCVDMIIWYRGLSDANHSPHC